VRIAVLVNTFPAVSETFVLRQITGLIDLGHEVDIYAEWPADGGCTHPEVETYEIMARTTYMDLPPDSGYYELPVWPITGRTWLPGAEKPVLNVVRVMRAAPTFLRCLARAPRLTMQVLDARRYDHQAASLSSLYRLREFASRAGDYDVIHAHFGPVGRTFRFARTLWNAPLLVSFHGYDFSAWPCREGETAYRDLFDVVDAVTVPSAYARRRLEALGCRSSRIHRLAYGVDIGQFSFRERRLEPGEPVRVLTVGRLVEKKGLEYSIRAVARVLRRHPGLRYDIVGDGPLRADLEELIRSLDLERNVTLLGARDGSEVRRMMAEAHIFMLSSVTAPDGDQEGTPVSLLEAQACGLPAISSRHSGISEIVLDGQSGYLVPERDVDGLADRLAYLAEHPETWAAMGLRGRRHIGEYHDIHRLNRQLVGLYEEVVRCMSS
jgi:colanic acid/amylovoran biosynthesis glycosyltransferase